MEGEEGEGEGEEPSRDIREGARRSRRRLRAVISVWLLLVGEGGE